MPQSLSQLVVHLVFSTKDRTPCLTDDVLDPLHAYLATVSRNSGSECFRVGGVADHVHLAVRLSRTGTVAELVEVIKTSSSKWLKTQNPRLRDFAWQRGYGAFSIGWRDLPALTAYIETQKEHHHSMSFKEEYLKFLEEHGLEADERYVWD